MMRSVLVTKVLGYGGDEDTLQSAANGMWDTIIAIARGKMTRREVLPEERLSVSCFGPSG